MNASSILVQLGQCGTQLGHQLFETIYQDSTTYTNEISAAQNEDYKFTSLENYFNETQSGNMEARSVMIDMEQKVVNQALHSAAKDSKWRYPKGSQLCRKLGSGNNWSYGFQVHGPRCEEEILDILHKEVEKCDRLSGFVVLMSLAGGTGSGLGSYVLQILKDNFSNSMTLNPTIAPYSAGEVSVQNFNALFSLSSTLSDASGSILLKNDHLHSICSKSLLIDKISLADLNRVASHELASVLQPSFIANGSQTDSSHRSRDLLFDIITSSCCHSQFKLLNLRCLPHLAEKSVPFSTFKWPGLLKNIKQMLITNFFVDEGMDWQVQLSGGELSHTRKPFKSISNILVLRGQSACSQSWSTIPEMTNHRFCTSWLPEHNRHHLWSVDRPFRNYEKSVSLLSNDSSCTEGLDLITQKAWNMFSSKAYVHQYTKYGLEEEDFLNAFIKVENVLDSYRKLAVQ